MLRSGSPPTTACRVPPGEIGSRSYGYGCSKGTAFSDVCSSPNLQSFRSRCRSATETRGSGTPTVLRFSKSPVTKKKRERERVRSLYVFVCSHICLAIMNQCNRICVVQSFLNFFLPSETLPTFMVDEWCTIPASGAGAPGALGRIPCSLSWEN